MTEVLRVSSVPHENYETTCRKCKREITLKFNGGACPDGRDAQWLTEGRD